MRERGECVSECVSERGECVSECVSESECESE